MTETPKSDSGESDIDAQDNSSWGEKYQKSVPHFNSDRAAELAKTEKLDSECAKTIRDFLDKDKIPKGVLNKLMGEANENSDFVYNVGVPFREQEISQEAKQILAEFSERYWNDRKSA